MLTRICLATLVLALAGLASPSSLAADETTETTVECDPYFLGWGTEPAMIPGGRVLESLDAGANRLLAHWTHAENKPALAAAWEIPFGFIFSIVNHEVNGHGGRAREFGLDPSYGFGFDLSAYTTIAKPPETNEQIILLSAGGTETDSVLSRRLTLDIFSPAGLEGSKAPLLLFAKNDLTLYVLGTTGPDDAPVFDEQYVDGNDMANYLVSRQADRVDADPMEVWERDYVIDFDDPVLEENWDDVRITALWNFLDPTVIWSFVSYVRFHLMQGDLRIEPLQWHVAEGYGLGLGTRGFLGPNEVTRFLDFYARTPHGVASAYVRDLKSSIDRSYGYGLGFHRARLATGIELSFQADFWDRPESLGTQDSDSGANASLQLDALFRKRAGFSAMAGRKSEGFFPGLPIAEGWYFSVGVLLSF